MKIYSLIVSVALLLSGCGGGDGGGSSSSTPADSVSSKRMTDLSVPADFDYRTEIPVTLHISLESRAEGQHYLSVYSRYQQSENGVHIPDVSSRLSNTPLKGTAQDVDLVFPSVAAPVLLELWSRDEPTSIQKLVVLTPEVLEQEKIEMMVSL